MGPDLIKAMNNLAVRIGAQAARKTADYLQGHLDPGLSDSVNTTTQAIPTGSQIVFETDYQFFAGAGESHTCHKVRYDLEPFAHNLPLRVA